MSKKVTFGAKPQKKPGNIVDPDKWVNNPATANAQTKRFTIDIPVPLHTRIKTQCASRGAKMREEVLTVLEDAFPEIS